MSIKSSLVESLFGPIVVQTNDERLSMLSFGSEEHIRDADDASPSFVASALRAVNDLKIDESLPLHLTGTPFQLRVWEALRKIPLGKTTTYRSLLGDGARAVGNALGKNEIALFVPCHRVVRADGSPGGYRWGEKRKETLLLMEKCMHFQAAHESLSEFLDTNPKWHSGAELIGINIMKHEIFVYLKKPVKNFPKTWEGYPITTRVVGTVRPA